jgi:hypothetical protein
VLFLLLIFLFTMRSGAEIMKNWPEVVFSCACSFCVGQTDHRSTYEYKRGWWTIPSKFKIKSRKLYKIALSKNTKDAFIALLSRLQKKAWERWSSPSRTWHYHNCCGTYLLAHSESNLIVLENFHTKTKEITYEIELNYHS